MPSTDEARNSETELKFEVARGALGKLLKHPALAVLPATSTRLHSVYYDTPEHDLRNAGLSLRVREADGRFIQTVKTREGPGALARGEWECEVAGPEPDVAALAGAPAAAVLNGHAADLAAVFSTTVERAVRMWRQGPTLVELSLDDGRIDAAGGQEAIHELELELKSGEVGDLFGLAHDLAGAAPIVLSFDSKAERGYRLAGHDATTAMKAEQAALTADTAAGDAFRRIARSCLAQVAGNAKLLLAVRSPHVLHQARVGLRRLRAALSAFEPLVRDGRFDALKAEAKWLAGEFDQARDLDVFIQTAMPADEEGFAPEPAIAAFGKRLLVAQARAYDRALSAVGSKRFADLLLAVAAWVEIGEWASDPERAAERAAPICGFGAEALERQHARLLKAGRHFGRLDAEGRHHLRIKGKKLRYAADFFGEAFPEHPKRRRRFVAGLKDLQELLGQLNDIAVAADLAAEVAGRRAGDAAFAAGLVIGARRCGEPALIEAAADAWRDFRRLKGFWPA